MGMRDDVRGADLCRKLAPAMLDLWAGGMAAADACEQVGQSRGWSRRWFRLAEDGHADYAWLAPLIEDAKQRRLEQRAEERREIARQVCAHVVAGVAPYKAGRLVDRGWNVSRWGDEDPAIQEMWSHALLAYEDVRSENKVKARMFTASRRRKGKQQDKPKVGRIYFIEAEGIDRVKVGYTTEDPEVRLGQLAVAAPAPLVLLCTFRGTMATERALHQLLQPHNTHREWFELNGPVRSVMDALRGRLIVTPHDVRALGLCGMP